MEKTADGEHIPDQKTVLKGLADIADQLFRIGVIRLHHNRAGDKFLVLFTAFQISTEMKGDKGDFILIESHLINMVEIVGKKHRHVIDWGVIFFQLRSHRVGNPHLVSAPLVGIVDMKDKLHDKIIVKFRDAVPFRHKG